MTAKPKSTVGVLLALGVAAAGTILSVATPPQPVFATQAPAVSPAPTACEGFLTDILDPDLTRRFRIKESGQYGSTVGGVGIAGRTCWRKFNYLARVGLNQGPQRLTVGNTVALSTTYYGGPFFDLVQDPVNGTVLRSPIRGDATSFSNNPQPTAWTWDINTFLDNEPAIRDIEGRLGSATWNYQQLFLIPPTFDMSGCGTGLNVGRRVPICTVRLIKGPYYPTGPGTTNPIPWTLFMGHYSSAGSTILPQLINNNGTLIPPQLTRYGEYIDAPVWIEPSPYARWKWTPDPEDPLTVEFDATGSLYNGIIDSYQWEFESNEDDWFRGELGAKVTQTFPGVGTYPVKLTIFADGQKDVLTGTVDLTYNAGGLSVAVDSANDALRVDPDGHRSSDHEQVTITVSNSSDEPAQNVQLNSNLFRSSVPDGPDPTLGFGSPEPGPDFFDFGVIAGNASVSKTFALRGRRAGEGQVVAEVSGGAKTAKKFTIAAGCRVGNTTSGGRGFSVLTGIGPPSSCPYIPPVDYLTPFSNGGSGTPQFQFDRTPTAEVTRQGPNGLEVFGGGTWTPRAASASNVPLSIAPQTWTAASEIGATRSEIADPGSFGGNPGNRPMFAPGDHVIVNPGAANEERRVVTALGSLIYDRPLSKAHALGEMITLDPIEQVGIPLATPLPAVVLGTLVVFGVLAARKRRRPSPRQ